MRRENGFGQFGRILGPKGKNGYLSSEPSRSKILDLIQNLGSVDKVLVNEKTLALHEMRETTIERSDKCKLSP